MPNSQSDNTVIKPAADAKPAGSSVLDIMSSFEDEPEIKEKKESEPEIKYPDNDPNGEEDDDDEKVKRHENEDDEDEIDLKSDTEDEVVLNESDIEAGAPPKKKEILKAYPDIEKKFPYLIKMLYRDREMRQLFGSFDEAKSAASRAEQYDTLERQLVSGNIGDVLNSVKTANAKGFSNLVQNLLPTLQQIDRDAHNEIIGDVVKRLTSHMAKYAKSKGDKDLETAAKMVNGYIFGDEDIVEPREIKADKKEDDELARREQEFNSKQRNNAVREVSSRVGKILQNTIADYIDKKGEMTPFVRKNAIRAVLEDIDERMSADTDFIKHIDRMWQMAGRDEYSRTSQNRIQSTYLGKVKPLIASAIKKARAEALKDLTPSRRVKKDDDSNEETTTDKKGRIPVGRSASSSRGNKPEIKPGESAMDFMMRD